MGIFKKLVNKNINKNNETKTKEAIEYDYKNMTLMYKDEKIADVTISGGTIDKIKNIYNIDRLPFGVVNKKNDIKGKATESLSLQDIANTEEYLRAWMGYRCIPSERINAAEVISIMGLKNTRELSCLSLGLSLTDSFWLKPSNAELEWSQVNLFSNGFSSDIGDLLLNPEYKNKVNPISPDTATAGIDIKRWIKNLNNKACLIKSNHNYEQVAYNEQIASFLSNKIGLNAVQYEVITSFVKTPDCDTPKKCVFAMSENFGKEDFQFVPADFFKVMLDNQTRHGVFDFIMDSSELKKSFQKMVFLDFLINNEDRHAENYGFMVNLETKEFHLAPVFDSGNSLYYDTKTENIGINDISKFPTHSHYENLEKIIKLPEDVLWYDPSMLLDIRNDIMNILSSSSMSEERKQKICDSVINRARDFDKYINNIRSQEKGILDTKNNYAVITRCVNKENNR